MKAAIGYLATVLVVVGLVSGVTAVLVDSRDWRVITFTAVAATATQMGAFAVAYALRKDQVMVGWGLGSLIRFAAVVVFWLVVSRLWRASVNPALLSFVAMLFVAMVVEPLFLRK